MVWRWGGGVARRAGQTRYVGEEWPQLDISHTRHLRFTKVVLLRLAESFEYFDKGSEGERFSGGLYEGVEVVEPQVCSSVTSDSCDPPSLSITKQDNLNVDSSHSGSIPS